MDLHRTPGRHFVLVVDSNSYRRRATLWELQARGCFTASASTGAEALTYATENEPDAVVADWDLSDTTGPELARRLKPASPATQIFLQKEEPDVRSLRETLVNGGEDLLPRHSALTAMLRQLECRRTPAMSSSGARPWWPDDARGALVGGKKSEDA